MRATDHKTARQDGPLSNKRSRAWATDSRAESRDQPSQQQQNGPHRPGAGWGLSDFEKEGTLNAEAQCPASTNPSKVNQVPHRHSDSTRSEDALSERMCSTGEDTGYRVVRRCLIGCTPRPIIPSAHVGEGREGGGYPAVGCWESFWESSPPKGVGAEGCREHFFAQRNQFLHLSPTSIPAISPHFLRSSVHHGPLGEFLYCLPFRTSCPLFCLVPMAGSCFTSASPRGGGKPLSPCRGERFS